jgi:hypothetical protein
MAEETVRERLDKGILHLRTHLESSGSMIAQRLAPINSALTLAGMAAIMRNAELKQRAENILEHHHWVPAVVEQTDPPYLITGPKGIQVKTYEGIMDLNFLTPYERILLVEFIERIDMGEYPELTDKSE